MDLNQNPRQIVILLLAVPMLLLASTAGSQELFYRVDSTVSIVHTSGGLFGGGLGDQTVSGTFEVIINGDQISFRSIDVAFSSDDFAWMVFPEYPGTLTGATFAGDEHPCPSNDPSWFSGSFVDDRIVFNGFYEMCAADGYSFDYSIEAVLLQQAAVPQLQTWGITVFSVAVLAIGIWIIRLKQ
jgi:hypothetical protein